MPARRQPVPAVDVDADEDRLEEEREALDRESEPEDRPEGPGEVRPQEAHLKAEDRAGDHPHGEEGDHHPGPSPGERAVEVVTRAQIEPLGEQHHRREGDSEADQRDVHHEGQRLHLAGLVQVVLRDRSERCQDHYRLRWPGSTSGRPAPSFAAAEAARLRPADPSCSHACRTRSAIAASSARPQARGSKLCLSPILPSTLRTPSQWSSTWPATARVNAYWLSVSTFTLI